MGAVFGGLIVGLSMTNPALSDYRAQVLLPAAEERNSSSDALVASIVQSLPISGSSQNSHDPSGLLSVLTNRTKRENYVIFSVYSTEFDYCREQTLSRAVSKTVGIGGKFITIEEGDCPNG
jgi:hypothetical protein